MTVALGVAVLVALLGWGFAVAYALDAVRWKQVATEWQALAEDGAASRRMEVELQAAVESALAKVWHHVTPETPEEGAAVAVLRAVIPGLPVPGHETCPDSPACPGHFPYCEGAGKDLPPPGLPEKNGGEP